MCFTINVNIIREEMEHRFNIPLLDPDNYRPSYYYHAFELPKIPVISSEKPDGIDLYQWGLIPSWTRDEEYANDIRYKTFNARSESITEKPSFRHAFRSNRCLVISKGFYEWQTVGKEKFPYYIYLSDEKIFTFAGLYDVWTNHRTGEISNRLLMILPGSLLRKARTLSGRPQYPEQLFHFPHTYRWEAANSDESGLPKHNRSL